MVPCCARVAIFLVLVVCGYSVAAANSNGCTEIGYGMWGDATQGEDATCYRTTSTTQQGSNLQRPFGTDNMNAATFYQVAEAVVNAEKESEPPCEGDDCVPLPATCCDFDTKVVAPMYAVSATTDAEVRVLQNYPEFVQPVVARTCSRQESRIIKGRCDQDFHTQPMFVAANQPPSHYQVDFIRVPASCRCVMDINMDDFQP